MNPVVWLGTPDVQMMPGLAKGVSVEGGSHQHQFVNPLAFGIPQPGTNGVYRLPYMHGPAFMDTRRDRAEELPRRRRKEPAIADEPLSTCLTTRWFRSTTTTPPTCNSASRMDCRSGADTKYAPLSGFRHCEYQGGKPACGSGSEVYVLTGSCRRTARRSGGSAGRDRQVAGKGGTAGRTRFKSAASAIC